MKQKIFHRLLFTYLAIIIIVVSALAIGLTWFFSSSIYRQKVEQLTAADRLVEARVLSLRAGQMTEKELVQSVNTVGAITGARVLVLQNDNQEKLHALVDQMQSKYGRNELGSDLYQILQGKRVIRKRQYLTAFSTYILFVGTPLRLNGQIKGMTLFFAPINQIDQYLLTVYRIIWGTALASLLLAALIILLISRRLTRPIIEIKEAAVALAEGNFTQPVAIQDHGDEIADLARSFNYMRDQLRRNEEMRKELIANVSHELRTPLTSIRGFIQGILEGVIPAEREDHYLRLAFEESERLARLVTDLLELAKLQAGGIRLEWRPLPLSLLMREAVEEVGLLAGERKIKVSVNLPEGMVLLGDRDRLLQIFLNLLSNSLKYTPAGGAIVITGHPAGRMAVITIADNGSGIPEEELERIFEKFHRVDRSREAATGGTGLGLAIVKELVALHGGRIAARSKLGKGTEMTLELPLAEETGRNY